MEHIKAWMSKNEFLLRRLHSLSGVIPVGFFLLEHLFTNSMAFYGPEKFNEHVKWLHDLPYLAILEFGFIFMPLAFHGIYGIYIARTGRSNAAAYGYMDNWRYTLQRVTGYIAFVFIIAHLAHFRFAWLFGGTEYVNHPNPFELTRQGFVGMNRIPPIAISATYLRAPDPARPDPTPGLVLHTRVPRRAGRYADRPTEPGKCRRRVQDRGGAPGSR